MPSRRVAIAGVALLAALIGAGLGAGGVWLAQRAWAPVPAAAVVCRPSLPALHAARDGRPVLLVFGNSLLFDVSWALPGITPVNCARQGHVARDAVASVQHLPAMEPAAILLGFGTVEAYRAVLAGRPADPQAFGAQMTALIAALQGRWPQARILVSGVPFPGEGGAYPALVRRADVSAFNAVLADIAAERGAVFLDLEQLPLLRAGRAGEISYDGLHLTGAVYVQWRALVAQALGSPG